jgi:hypothetical protein
VDVVVDVRLITAGDWEEAVGLRGLGEELLEGFETLGSPELESWLLPSVAISLHLPKT